MTDYFDNLLECSWRGISFPVTGFRTQIRQGIALHARPDQDGARVEATGRDPISFSCTIPCRNGIAAGKNETWGVLYPDTWRALIRAFSDRSKGTLVHPSLGAIVCKPVACESSLDAGKRDGEDLSVEWIEFSEDEDASNAIFGAESPIGGATLEAIDLDSRLASTVYASADPDLGSPSFEDAMRSIQGAVDTASLLSRQQFGLIDRVAYRVNNILFAVRSAKDPQAWETKQSLVRLLSSVSQLKARALQGTKDVSLYIVPGPTTLANIAAKLSNKVTDLIRLNPSMTSTPEIQANTPIRYFKAT